MPFDFAPYKIGFGEKPASAPKYNNAWAAIETGLNHFPLQNLHGYPGDVSKFLDGLGVWTTPAVATAAVYAKTSPTSFKNAANVFSDVFGNDFTIGAGKLGANGAIKLWGSGQILPTEGGTYRLRAQLKLGGTIIWDSGSGPLINVDTSAHRNWWLQAYIQALGSTTSQRGGGVWVVNDFGEAVVGGGQVNGGGLVVPFATITSSKDMAAAQTLTFEVQSSLENVVISCFIGRVEVMV